MEKQSQSRGPLIVAVVLLLLMLYVGSYLALVVPRGSFALVIEPDGQYWETRNYRCGESVSKSVFWPLEQIDRKLRPGEWRKAMRIEGAF